MKNWFIKKKEDQFEATQRKPIRHARALTLPSLCPGEHLVIGKEADIVTGQNDPYVSRRHATLRRLMTGEYQIIDGAMIDGSLRASANGVFVAKPGGAWEQVQGYQNVRPATVIRLGANTFVEVPPDSQSFQIDL